MADPGAGATGTTRRRGDVVLEDIVCRAVEGGSSAYYKYELENVMVTSFYSSGSTEECVPVETVTFNFEEITVTYTETDSEGKSKGNVEFNWRVEEGETS